VEEQLMSIQRNWYAVYCHAQKERLAKEQLLNQGFDVYLPLYKKVTRHARQIREVSAPLFPRYLFVGFDAQKEQWRSVNSTRGVACLVMQSGEKPRSVPDKVIYQLQESEDEVGLVSLAALELFQPGQSVRILEGVFAGHVAIYQKMTDKERAEILLHFLNQDVRMQVPAHAIEKTK
jgi:transcriptional antiterminator RfaH